ncbi:Uncharacterised protein [Vibrio cholerae]|nr:Uncharacterised protein [Vibrio cholerae]
MELYLSCSHPFLDVEKLQQQLTMQQKNQSELATNHSPTALNHFFLQKRFLQKYLLYCCFQHMPPHTLCILMP